MSQMLETLARPVLDVRGVSKAFAGKSAVSGVSLEVRKGEVVGLVGENGAGKSTLLKMISGNLRPDAGTITVGGRDAAFSSYRDAMRAGVFHIYQDLALIPTMSVYENVLLSHEPEFSRFGVIDNRRMRDHVASLLREFGHERIDPDRKVGSYDFSTRQVIEIIKSFALAELLKIETPTMLLDEPTAALTGDEVEFLMRVIEKARPRVAIIYVSHRLSEVTRVSQRVYVLKDGAVVAALSAAEVNEGRLHELMVGRTREEFFYREHLQQEPATESAMKVTALSRGGLFEDVSLTLKAGEILGIAGLLGSGKSDLARALAGDLKGVTGRVEVGEHAIRTLSVKAMSEAGIGYLPPDRRDSIIPLLSVAKNMTLARLTRTRESVFLDIAKEDADARRLGLSLGIKSNGIHALASTLSGGNQQKILLARWLLRETKVLILDNPTNGVDAGAKEEIYAVLRQIATSGVGILLVSDDLLELIGLSNRLLVMRSGRIIREIASPRAAKPREVDIVADMV